MANGMLKNMLIGLNFARLLKAIKYFMGAVYIFSIYLNNHKNWRKFNDWSDYCYC